MTEHFYNANMNGKTPPAPSLDRYAPQPATPDKIGSATLGSIAKIGRLTADEIRQTAINVMQGATEIAGKLNELADAVEGNAEIAAKQVTVFCQAATSVFQGALELQARLKGEEPPKQPAVTVETALAAEEAH